MNHFSTTPEAILEISRNFFLSERFSQAFQLLRDSFDNEEVSNDTVFMLLRGEKTLASTDEQNSQVMIVDVDTKMPENEDEISEDLEYFLTAKEILDNYDFNVMVNGQRYQIVKTVKFDLDIIESSNEIVKHFKENKGKVSTLPAHIITMLEKAAPSSDFLFYDHVIYFKGHFFLLEPYTRPVYVEFCKVYENPEDACIAFANNWEISI